MKFLYAAYAATWIIHIGYILSLNARVRRLHQDWDELRSNRQT